MNNIDNIKNRLAAATPGPWWMDDADQVVRADDRGIIYDQSCDSPSQWPDATAEFIAHAPEDIARLVKALEAILELCEIAETPMLSSQTLMVHPQAIRDMISDGLKAAA